MYSRCSIRIFVLCWMYTQLSHIGCADSDSKKTKVETSEPTFAGEYAFIGTLDVGHDNVTRPLCIVTALKENWVITAFSCLSELMSPGEELTLEVLNSAGAIIKLPNFKLSSCDIGENTVRIKQVLIGDRFQEDNLVLLQLTTPISKELVRKVKLDSQTELNPKDVCVNVGWIPKVFSGKPVPEDNGELQEVAQKVKSLKANESIVYGHTIPTTKNNGTCKFENGSPLLCEEDSKWNLVAVAGNLGDGVASRECQSPSADSAYISIEPFIQWIFSQIREKTKGQK